MPKKQESLDALFRKALKGSVKEARTQAGGRKLTGYERGSAKYIAEKKFTNALSRMKSPWAMGDDDNEIIDGMARAVFADQWAQRQEQRGNSFSGMDVYDEAPKTPSKARTWAKRNAVDILRLNPNFKNLTEMFEFVVDERGYNRDAESFGSDLGMESVGHGVSWRDRADYRKTKRDDIKTPHNEFYL